jgi:type II secretory pathway pseudopilin PulG
MQFHAILIVAALWAKWGLVLIGMLIAIVAGASALQQVVRQIRADNADAEVAAEADAEAAAEADRLDRLRARAGQQHAWVHASDLRGIYNRFDGVRLE